MNEERKKVEDIFNFKVKLKNPENQKKQEKIKKLIIKNMKVEGLNYGDKK